MINSIGTRLDLTIPAEYVTTFLFAILCIFILYWTIYSGKQVFKLAFSWMTMHLLKTRWQREKKWHWWCIHNINRKYILFWTEEKASHTDQIDERHIRMIQNEAFIWLKFKCLLKASPIIFLASLYQILQLQVFKCIASYIWFTARRCRLSNCFQIIAIS